MPCSNTSRADCFPSITLLTGHAHFGCHSPTAVLGLNHTAYTGRQDILQAAQHCRACGIAFGRVILKTFLFRSLRFEADSRSLLYNAVYPYDGVLHSHFHGSSHRNRTRRGRCSQSIHDYHICFYDCEQHCLLHQGEIQTAQSSAKFCRKTAGLSLDLCFPKQPGAGCKAGGVSLRYSQQLQQAEYCQQCGEALAAMFFIFTLDFLWVAGKSHKHHVLAFLAQVLQHPSIWNDSKCCSFLCTDMKMICLKGSPSLVVEENPNLMH